MISQLLCALGVTVFIGSWSVSFAQPCEAHAVVPELIGQMHDPAWEVRARAFYGVIACGRQASPDGLWSVSRPVLASLFRAMPDHEDKIRVSLIGLLETENRVVPRGRFSEEYSNYYGDVIAAVAAINEIRADPRTLDGLIGAITTGGMATNGLASLGDAAFVRVEMLAIGDQAQVRSSALFVLQSMLQPANLGRMRDPAEVRGQIKLAFISGLTDKDASVRSSAASGLGAIGEQDALPLLQAISVHDPACLRGQKADDGDGDLCPVRVAARRAMAKINALK